MTDPYQAMIEATQRQIDGLQSQVSALRADLAAHSEALRTELVKAMSGVMLRTDNVTLARIVAKGNAELARR